MAEAFKVHDHFLVKEKFRDGEHPTLREGNDVHFALQVKNIDEEYLDFIISEYIYVFIS